MLKELFPEAKFIVSLRRPQNRAFSLYRHMRRHRHADGQPFELMANFPAAVLAEADRHQSRAFFADCRQYFWNFLYCRLSFYDEQLSRYFSLFRRDQFHVLSLAELSSDPVAAATGIATFLDLDPAQVSKLYLSPQQDSGPYAALSIESKKSAASCRSSCSCVAAVIVPFARSSARWRERLLGAQRAARDPHLQDAIVDNELLVNFAQQCTGLSDRRSNWSGAGV